MTADLIREQIELRGPMTFRDFTDLALYHPKYGYYHRSATPRGRAGDYFTSMQVSTLFPEIFADAVIAMKEALGSDLFSLVEVGSGSGEFLHGVLAELTRRNKMKGFYVWSVEKSRPARDNLNRLLSRFPKCRVVSSLDDIDWDGRLEGCIFSNEFFDALPFHRLRFEGKSWQEIFVDIKGGVLVETVGPLSPRAATYVPRIGGFEYEPGQEIEVRPEIDDVYTAWGNLFLRGYIVTVDYGQPRAALYDPSRPQGTWRCFYRHQVGAQALEHVGEQDITAHIDFTQLVEAGRQCGFDPLLFSSQGLFLSHIGQDRIQKGLDSTDPAEKKQMISTVQQLVHPGSMGERFWVLLQAKEASLPAPFSAIPSRLSRLKS